MRREIYLRSFCPRRYIRFILAAVVCAAGAALADWDVGDPALYYQLPDETYGWSVYGDGGGEEPAMLADDWTAATTAQISDIFFWGGWRGDAVGTMADILVQIFDDDASMPGECVWSRVFPEGQYEVRLFANERQNFFDPRQPDYWRQDDHNYLFQYSIPMITDPFTAQAGQTYWLLITTDAIGGMWGWNTADSVNGSPAVFWDQNNAHWTQLLTPDSHVPLDVAFVLVPEPATLLLLGIGVPMLSGLIKRKS